MCGMCVSADKKGNAVSWGCRASSTPRASAGCEGQKGRKGRGPPDEAWTGQEPARGRTARPRLQRSQAGRQPNWPGSTGWPVGLTAMSRSQGYLRAAWEAPASEAGGGAPVPPRPLVFGPRAGPSGHLPALPKGALGGPAGQQMAPRPHRAPALPGKAEPAPHGPADLKCTGSRRARGVPRTGLQGRAAGPACCVSLGEDAGGLAGDASVPGQAGAAPPGTDAPSPRVPCEPQA